MKVQAYVTFGGRCDAQALGEGANVTRPLMKTFWTSSFGTLTDKFGVPWMVYVAMPKT